jgi:hypothetical protein
MSGEMGTASRVAKGNLTLLGRESHLVRFPPQWGFPPNGGASCISRNLNFSEISAEPERDGIGRPTAHAMLDLMGVKQLHPNLAKPDQWGLSREGVPDSVGPTLWAQRKVFQPKSLTLPPGQAETAPRKPSGRLSQTTSRRP